MSHFHVYVDPESRSHAGVFQTPLSRGVRAGPVGKIFHSNQAVPLVARKALGDVRNQELPKTGFGRPTVKQQPREQVQCRPIALLKSFSDIKQSRPNGNSRSVKSATEKSCRVREECEPIEQMIPYREEDEDECEDLWPQAERPTTYLSEIENCRPPVFGRACPSSLGRDHFSSEESVPEREYEACRIERVPSLDDLFVTLPPFLQMPLNGHKRL